MPSNPKRKRRGPSGLIDPFGPSGVGRIEYRDIDGSLIVGTLTWAKLFEKRRIDGSFRVGQDFVDGHEISTVWLGMEHGWRDGKPLIFETMIFKEGSRRDCYCERYATYSEAMDGHVKAVELIKAEATEQNLTRRQALRFLQIDMSTYESLVAQGRIRENATGRVPLAELKRFVQENRRDKN